MHSIIKSYTTDTEQHIYIAPNIDRTRLRSFLQRIKEESNIQIPELNVLVYFDNTVLGGGKEGAALTKDKIVYNAFGKDAWSAPLAEIRSIAISGMLNVTVTLTMENNKILELVLTQSNKGARLFVDIIKQYLNKTKGNEDDGEAIYDDSWTELMKAVGKGELNTVVSLLSKGADVEEKDNSGYTALSWAALVGQAKIAELLLSRGANIEVKDKNGFTPLIIAASRGNIYTVELLLEKGANIEAKSNVGVTALLYASLNGLTEIVALLLKKGANIEAKLQDGSNSLMAAAMEGQTEIVELLLNKGANIEAKSNYGSTALIFACLEGHTETVALLLKKGANIGQINTDGKTALSIAEEKGYSAIVKLLKSTSLTSTVNKTVINDVPKQKKVHDNVTARNKDGKTAPIRTAEEGDTDPPYPGEFYILGTLYEGRFTYMPFPQVVGKGTKYKAEDLLRKFTSEEVSKIVAKIDSEKKIPYLVFIKEILDAKMDLPDKAPYWFIPFVIVGRNKGTMLYFNQDGFWQNSETPQILKQCSPSGMIDSIETIKGHFPDFIMESFGGNNPLLTSDADTISTMRVNCSNEGGIIKQDIAEMHGNGYGSQLKIIEAIWNIWKDVVEQSRGKSTYMYDPAIFKFFHSWQAVIDWAYEDKEELAGEQKMVNQKQEHIDEKRNRTTGIDVNDKKSSYKLIYETNAVKCNYSMPSFIFSRKRLAEIGIIEPSGDYECYFDQDTDLNSKIIDAMRADIRESGKVPFFFFDDGDDESAWQGDVYLDDPSGKDSSLKEIYDSLGYPSERGPFFFGNKFIINSDFKTSVIFTQDGFITFDPGGQEGWVLNPWEAFQRTQLVSLVNSPEPSIDFLPGQDGVELVLSSPTAEAGRHALHHESVILLMIEIIEQFWECVEASRNSETQEIPHDKFRFITSDNIDDYAIEILNKSGIHCARVDGRNEKTKVTRKKQKQKKTDAVKQAKENLDSEFLNHHTEPSYPGQFYFLTEKYSSKPINIKNFLRLSRTDKLFRSFTKNEVDNLVKKIKTTKTIPKLGFIRDILEEKYEIPVKDAPFWFLPFAILAEKIGCFLYIDRNAIYANYEKARVISPCFSWEGATDVTYGNGFLELEDGDDGKLEISISPDPDAEYSDPEATVSTLVLETGDGPLTINEFHGDEFGSQLLIIKTIWDLWKIVVDYSRGSSIWPQDDKVPNGPEYIYFDSWDDLLAWAEAIVDDKRIELFRAAYEGDIEKVKSLLEAGVDIEAKSNEDHTALYYAASSKSMKTVELLLKKGADIEAIDVETKFRIGYAYSKGEGVPVNKKEAVKWYKKAAEQGYADAQYYLGNAYSKGEGVPEDPKEAVKWYRKAADQGYKFAQFFLGSAYSEGEGVPVNKEEAVIWYKKSAIQGFDMAQYVLGCAYYDGDGVPIDKEEGAKWHKKAADQGFDGSQYYLGWAYENGEGVPENHEEALKWYKLAAEQDYEGAQEAVNRLSGEKASQSKDSQQAVAAEDDDEKAPKGKRITYESLDDFSREQGAKDERKKENLPIAMKIHDLLFNVLKAQNKKFEIRYGDGTFSFSIPKDKAKSGKRTFARVGLLSLADKCVYLDTLYRIKGNAIPTGSVPWKKNDDSQFVFRMKTIEDFEKMKDSIKLGVIGSYDYLAK